MNGALVMNPTVKLRPETAGREIASKQSGCVLVVDDDSAVRRAVARMIRSQGHRTLEASSARHALDVLKIEPVDVLITDVNMPDMDGFELLSQVRGAQLDIPALFLTGSPTIDTAAQAVEQGAFRYLVKPVSAPALYKAVDDALSTRALLNARHQDGRRAEMEASFYRALEGLYIHVQPIVSVETHTTIGYEALMRSGEPALPHPGAVLEAAEKLGALHVLGRHVRALTARMIETAPPEARFFVNLHPADLADADLFDAAAPLSQHAHRIVLELTERASLESVPNVAERIAELRAMRYGIAVDDLGAGYAGLTYFASVNPEIIKIDMSLVRGIDADAVKQRIVLAMVSLAITLGMEIVAEGVETLAERDCVARLGCHYVQGYLLARPGPPFPLATWS
jgi:EAL domain-containing protein (putative c-di-GMP-specific phosphodiesterase class I)